MSLNRRETVATDMIGPICCICNAYANSARNSLSIDAKIARKRNVYIRKHKLFKRYYIHGRLFNC